ncbi:hypothetical protein JZ751_004988, partial [Albula glossodonta]
MEPLAKGSSREGRYRHDRDWSDRNVPESINKEGKRSSSDQGSLPSKSCVSSSHKGERSPIREQHRKEERGREEQSRSRGERKSSRTEKSKQYERSKGYETDKRERDSSRKRSEEKKDKESEGRDSSKNGRQISLPSTLTAAADSSDPMKSGADKHLASVQPEVMVKNHVESEIVGECQVGSKENESSVPEGVQEGQVEEESSEFNFGEEYCVLDELDSSHETVQGNDDVFEAATAERFGVCGAEMAQETLPDIKTTEQTVAHAPAVVSVDSHSTDSRISHVQTEWQKTTLTVLPEVILQDAASLPTEDTHSKGDTTSEGACDISTDAVSSTVSGDVVSQSNADNADIVSDVMETVVISSTEPEKDGEKPVTGQSLSKTQVTDVPKVSTTFTGQSGQPEQGSGQISKECCSSEPDSTEDEERHAKPSSSVPLAYDEDSMMLTLKSIQQIPEAISPLTSPVRPVKKSLPHCPGKGHHVKSLSKDLSTVTGARRMDVNKENEKPHCSSTQITQSNSDQKPPSSSSSSENDNELEEGEIISDCEDDEPPSTVSPSKNASSAEKPAACVRRLSHNSSLQDKSDFEILTEQQTSSLTFNLVTDSQMGEIFKCLLQGSDLLENSVSGGDTHSWPVGTPRKDSAGGESFVVVATPNKTTATPSKILSTWSNISPCKFSPNPKLRVPLNPAILDESCLLEVPSSLPLCKTAASSTVPSQKSYSILAEDLAVSLTIPSPLKSDGHLSFLNPDSGEPVSAPDSVISAHFSEDALMDGEDATEQDIHLALDSDNSSASSSGCQTWEQVVAPPTFQFKPHLPMQAVVMEKSNDHFIVRIRHTST